MCQRWYQQRASDEAAGHRWGGIAVLVVGQVRRDTVRFPLHLVYLAACGEVLSALSRFELAQKTA